MARSDHARGRTRLATGGKHFYPHLAVLPIAGASYLGLIVSPSSGGQLLLTNRPDYSPEGEKDSEAQMTLSTASRGPLTAGVALGGEGAVPKLGTQTRNSHTNPKLSDSVAGGGIARYMISLPPQAFVSFGSRRAANNSPEICVSGGENEI